MRSLLLAAPLLLLPLAAAAGCAGSREGGETLSGRGLYIALGDSLSDGVGASDRDATAFVPLVHRGLGEGWQLINLSRSGDTSDDLLRRGWVDAATALIQQRNGDDDPDNDARLVTLEIGGNDLLTLFDDLVLSGACPGLESALAKPTCVDALRKTLDRVRANLTAALDLLHGADPDVEIAVMTLYNPISRELGPAGVQEIREVAELALEGQQDTPFPEGLNDIILEETRKRALTLVDLHPLFEGKASRYIAGDYIHPNDTGHGVMAEAVLDAVR